jgi:hypothetical protein
MIIAVMLIALDRILTVIYFATPGLLTTMPDLIAFAPRKSSPRFFFLQLEQACSYFAVRVWSR